MDSTETFDRERQAMVTWQIAGRGIRDERLLLVMRSVPRHHYVPLNCRDMAYQDRPLPIGYGQTISQPYMIALMTELLNLTGEEVVLEIGTGSGYQAAILAHLARHVHTVEMIMELAERAQKTLDEEGIRNVTVHPGDGSAGLPDFGPYGGMIVTAAAPVLPQPLLEQLAVNARLVIPVGSPGHQVLQLWQRKAQGYEQESIAPVAFVPLRGAYGWSYEDWGPDYS